MTVLNPKLHQLAQTLSERDWQILGAIRDHRYLTSRQVARLYFNLEPGTPVIPRPANHALARLRELGLLVNLKRRIGGVRAGSGGYVWTITDQANRFLAWRNNTPISSRVREYEPTPAFLEHTLAVAEVVLDLNSAGLRGHVAVSRVELEPACWRVYLGIGGASLRLKPDLALVTATGDFEDHWFIEVDRETEPPSRIIRKCLQYQEYQRTGSEQERTGVFPAVVWVVPNAARREQLDMRLAKEATINQRLFSVIIPEQLEQLITDGPQNFNNQTGEQQGGQSS